MVNDNSIPKGMKGVLEEHGINTERMIADDMRTVLSFYDDFANEKTIVEKLVTDKGHKCVFLAKVSSVQMTSSKFSFSTKTAFANSNRSPCLVHESFGSTSYHEKSILIFVCSV